MTVIQHSGVLLAKHITSDDWSDGLAFFSDDGDFLQVGTWAYRSGKALQRHRHLECPRAATRTQEALVVVAGKVRASVYAEDGTHVSTVTASAGDVLILLSGGHGYEILEDGTRVVEVKNGPYPGADRDRRRF